jgi:hypothetical protein
MPRQNDHKVKITVEMSNGDRKVLDGDHCVILCATQDEERGATGMQRVIMGGASLAIISAMITESQSLPETLLDLLDDKQKSLVMLQVLAHDAMEDIEEKLEERGSSKSISDLLESLSGLFR